MPKTHFKTMYGCKAAVKHRTRKCTNDGFTCSDVFWILSESGSESEIWNKTWIWTSTWSGTEPESLDP